jgi:hypothetical protein
MIDLIDAIRRESDMEPILQVALLRKVVEAAVTGSEPLREALAAVKAHLDEPNVDVNVPWMNPELRRQPNRAEAAGLVQSLPDLALARTDALDRRDRAVRGISRVYRTVGWLSRDADGWQLRAGAVLPNGDLWVVAPKEDRHGEWRKAGTTANGKPEIDATAGSVLVEGRPVFVMSDAP